MTPFLATTGKIVAQASSPAGSDVVSSRDSNRNDAASQRDAAGTRSRGRLRYKNRVMMVRAGVGLTLLLESVHIFSLQ